MTPAEDADVWVHHALFPTEINCGRINPKLLVRGMKQSRFCDCTFEISGRALSLATDIEANAVREVEKILTRKPTSPASFLGVVYASVAEIRASREQDYDVYIEEMDGDPAHADLVCKTPLPLIGGQIDIAAVRTLTEKFSVALPRSNELAILESKAGVCLHDAPLG